MLRVLHSYLMMKCFIPTAQLPPFLAFSLVETILRPVIGRNLLEVIIGISGAVRRAGTSNSLWLCGWPSQGCRVSFGAAGRIDSNHQFGKKGLLGLTCPANTLMSLLKLLRK